MKKQLANLLFFLPIILFSQTNTFPNSGNVGVGTNVPLTKLHVYNGSSGNSPHGFSDFSVEDDENVLMTLMTQNTKYAYYGFADSDDDFVGGIQYNHANDMMYFRVNDRNADMVITNNGRVGIGKTSPASDLDVEGGIRSSDGNDNVTIRSVNANNYSEIIWGDDTNDRFRFYYNYWNGTSLDKEVMSLLPNGDVGIGTTTPDAKLTVKGDIHAEEVKVDLSVPGPDYVFKEDYDLKPLEEVQNYIKANGHLPNIPSAKEMEENGIQLGEMNMKLLEKIEELTLYVIELKNEINLLKEDEK
nr:tail fiber protein [uncultured Allomuricauda sp.]